MAELGLLDQAAGLRRLFGNRTARTVTFVHIRRGPGSALTVARTANALAAHGQQVVIVDEHQGADSVTAMTGQTPQYDLFDAFIGDCALTETFLAVTPRINVVPAARAAREFGIGEADIEQRMAACMAELGVKAGFVLVDGGVRHGDISQLAKATDHLAIVTRPGGRSVTETYSLIKQQSSRSRRREFQIVLDGVGQTLLEAAGARTLFQNLKTTAQAHLEVNLHHLASITAGSVDALADGLLTRLPDTTPDHAQRGNVLRLRGLFSPSGLFESVV